jgi:hypothetical protein
MRDVAAELMLEYVGFMRMMQLWFHGAHHLTRGTSFAGDHVNLYGTIYQAVEDQIDGAIEKAIGLFGDQWGCPLYITDKALEIMMEYPSPLELKSAGQAAVGLQIEKDFLKFSQNLYDELKRMRAMTLGLDDMIMANANAHETHVYLLQQRIKSALDQ